jgi:hypothetical protein
MPTEREENLNDQVVAAREAMIAEFKATIERHVNDIPELAFHAGKYLEHAASTAVDEFLENYTDFVAIHKAGKVF